MIVERIPSRSVIAVVKSVHFEYYRNYSFSAHEKQNRSAKLDVASPNRLKLRKLLSHSAVFAFCDHQMVI